MLTREVVRDLVIQELHKGEREVWHIALSLLIHPHAVEGAVQELLREGSIERVWADPSFYRLKQPGWEILVPSWFRWMCQPR